MAPHLLFSFYFSISRAPSLFWTITDRPTDFHTGWHLCLASVLPSRVHLWIVTAVHAPPHRPTIPSPSSSPSHPCDSSLLTPWSSTYMTPAWPPCVPSQLSQLLMCTLYSNPLFWLTCKWNVRRSRVKVFEAVFWDRDPFPPECWD